MYENVTDLFECECLAELWRALVTGCLACSRVLNLWEVPPGIVLTLFSTVNIQWKQRKVATSRRGGFEVCVIQLSSVWLIRDLDSDPKNPYTFCGSGSEPFLRFPGRIKPNIKT